jgi:subtilisin family serine protease
VKPTKTSFDAGLSIVHARAATTPSEAGMPGRSTASIVNRMAILGVVEQEIESIVAAQQPSEPEIIWAKLIVSSSDIARAEEWVVKHGGGVESTPPTPERETGAATVIVRLPVTELSELEPERWVRRIEAPNQLMAALDEARGEATGLDTALRSKWAKGLTGAGVLLAVIDTGVDWQHPDFIQPDGHSKIELFVHASRKRAGSAYTSFDRDSLSAALDPSSTAERPPVGDTHGHGTHCASIATGLGTASNGTYRGVAPGAALFAMRNDGLYDDHTIWGIRRAFELAGNRPAVVSLSLGGHFGAHDGTSALENEISRMSGPGRIIVCAAGNEGTDAIHAIGDLHSGTVEFPFVVADDFQIVDVWIPRPDDVDVSLIAPNGERIEPPATEHGIGQTRVSATFLLDQINRDQNFRIEIIGGTHPTSVWKIVVEPNEVVHGVVHAWASINDPVIPAQIMRTPDQTHTVGMPATEERCIAVGSFVTRPASSALPGAVSSFSSRGPTRVGAMKPDITAPGEKIVGARASDHSAGTADPDPYVQMSGTSMATPFIAGLVALLLQRQPNLGPEEIQQYFRATANRDAFTGLVWNPNSGWGRIDVRALFEYLEEIGIP